MAGVSILVKGDLNKKAELVFQSFDKDGNGLLSRKEVAEAAANVLKTAAKIAEAQVFHTFRHFSFGSV